VSLFGFTTGPERAGDRQATQAPSEKHSGPAGWLCALSLIGAALIPSVLWIARDRTPWPWDQAWYGEVSVDLWFNATHSMADWCRTMLTGLNMKPPGIVWLGQLFVPFGSLGGSIEHALLFSVLLTQAITLYVVFQTGRAIAPGTYAVPAIGVCVAAGAQSFVSLSHQFFVEPLQALAVAWIVLIAVRSMEWPTARVVLHLAAALTAGALAKTSTLLYCLLPCLYIGFVLCRKPLRQGWRSEWRTPSGRALVFSIAAAVPFTAAWYMVNFKAAWQHVRDSSSGTIALDYGFRAPVERKLVVWLGLLNQSFWSPYLGWVAILAVLIGFLAFFGPGGKRSFPRAGKSVAALSALQCGLLLLVLSVNDAVEPRYPYALLPLWAAIVMGLCTRVPGRLAFVPMFALCGLQFAAVNGAALGITGPLANQFPWLVKPQAELRQYSEVERIVRMTSTVAGRYNIVGVEEPWLNANTASFFAAKHRLDTGTRSYFTSLGYAQRDLAGAVKRVEELNAMYYITLEGPFQSTPPNFLNVVSLPMLQHVRTDPRFEQVAAPSAEGVVIFRRH
jgi:hypothetical protein